MVVSLDNLEEHGGPVLHVLGEDLQEVAVVIEVDQDAELLQDGHVLRDLNLGALQSLPQLLVVGRGYPQELLPTLTKTPDL